MAVPQIMPSVRRLVKENEFKYSTMSRSSRIVHIAAQNMVLSATKIQPEMIDIDQARRSIDLRSTNIITAARVMKTVVQHKERNGMFL